MTAFRVPHRVASIQIGRTLVCTSCRTPVEVIEAAQGARTDDEHRYLDSASYRCGDCQAAAGEVATVGDGSGL